MIKTVTPAKSKELFEGANSKMTKSSLDRTSGWNGVLER